MSGGGAIVYVGARLLSGVLSFVAVGLFARRLGPAGYGWIALSTALGALSAGVVLQPVQQSLARFLPRVGFDALVPTLARTLLGLAAALLPLALAVEALQLRALPAGVLIAGCALATAQGVFDFTAQHLNSTFAPGRYAAMYATKGAVVVALGYGAIIAGLGAPGVVAAMCASMIGAAIAWDRTCWRRAWRGSWSRAALGDVTGYAVPLAGTLFVGAVLQWADRVVVAAALGPTWVGRLGACADIAQQSLGLLVGAAFLSWFPRIVVAHEQGDRPLLGELARRYMTVVLAIMAPAAVGLTLVRRGLAAAVLGDAYLDDATLLVPWLAAAATLAGVRTFVFEVGLHVSGRMPLLLRNAVVGAVVSVSLNVVLVPRLGLLGAGVSATCAQTVGCVLAWLSARGVLEWRVSRSDLFSILLGCLTMALVVSLVEFPGVLGLCLQVGAGALAYLLVALAANTASCRNRLGVALLRVRGAL